MRIPARAIGLMASLLLSDNTLCAQAAAGAGWPAVSTPYEPRDDSAFVTLWPADSSAGRPPNAVFRRLYVVIFDLRAPADSVRAVIQRARAVVAGGALKIGMYYLRLPDPGPQADDVTRTIAGLQREAYVLSVSVIPVNRGLRLVPRTP
jgi:hypothetical protein